MDPTCALCAMENSTLFISSFAPTISEPSPTPLLRRRFLPHKDHPKIRYCAKFGFQASDSVLQIAGLHGVRLLMVILYIGKALQRSICNVFWKLGCHSSMRRGRLSIYKTSDFHLISPFGPLFVSPVRKNCNPPLRANEYPHHYRSQCQQPHSGTNSYTSFPSVCHVGHDDNRLDIGILCEPRQIG